MPYQNLPESDWDRMDSCVKDVMAKGHDKQSAIAICYTSIAGKESRDVSAFKAKYPWDKCIEDNLKRYGDKATAEKVCGAIRAGKERSEVEAELGLDQPQTFEVFKQADGAHRWLMVSSNAYRDNDGEIVSLKAQEQDVARMDATHNYGPLRWWHVPGLDIGACDFAATHGRMRVESGTFATKEIGANIAAKSNDLAVSLGFTHSASEPDDSGVYHNINVFERSLLPKTKAANPYTFISVQKEFDMASLKEKLQEFAGTVFGGDQRKAEQFAAKIETAQKEIEGAGVAFKETTVKADMPMNMAQDAASAAVEPDEDEPVLLEDASVEELKAALAAKEAEGKEAEAATKETTQKAGGKSGPAERDAMFAAMHDEGTYDESAVSGGGRSAGGKKVPNRQRTSFRKAKKKKELSGEGEDTLTVGDLTPDEFVAVMSDWLAPVAAEVKEIKTTKEAQAVTLKAAVDTIEQLKARLSELEGGRSKVDIFRASRQGPEPAAVTPPQASAKEKAVLGDETMNWFVNGSRNK